MTQPPQQPGKPRRRIACLGCLGLVVFLGVVGVGTAVARSHSPSALPAPQTVTVIVTGDQADVTYGPTGSDLAGTVPMDETASIPADPPRYYAVTAQLQGSGTVSCEIEVDGKALSQATASGGYNIARCEISRDFLGHWQDDN
jgi:hypothetical protein